MRRKRYLMFKEKGMVFAIILERGKENLTECVVGWLRSHL